MFAFSFALTCKLHVYILYIYIYLHCLLLVMVALWNIFALRLLLSSLFFSSPNLSRRRLDVCHTSTHDVALVQVSDAGLKPAARGSLKTQDAKKSPKSPSGYHHTTLLGYIFATKACIDSRKKNLLSSNMSSTCPHNMVNFGPIAAEIGLPVWAPLQI